MRGVHALAFCALASIASAANAQEIDWKKVDEAIGRSAAAVAGDVHRYAFPRSDLTVTVDGVTIRPALALGGWTAFKPMHGGVMIMGDLVLLETEINPVMLKLIQNGAEITAVHNHLLRGSPETFYMHVGGHGDPVKLAAALRAALAESRTPLTTPAPAATQPAIDLDTAQLDQIIGVKGQANGGVYQFAVPRRDPVSEEGVQLAPVGPLGVATAMGFQPTGQSCHHRRFCLGGGRSESRHPGAAVKRDRGDGAAQPYAHRAAAAVLHAFLGERRRAQACAGVACRARQDRERQELTCWSTK
jgi:Domain of Unknown Function (DUF1259)